MSAIDAPAPPPTAAPVDAIMSVQDVAKVFGGLTAVGGVSLDVPRRSIVSVIGPNGAGKTTLFNMLTGLYKPTSGRVIFDGKVVNRSRPDQDHEAWGCAHVPEHPPVRRDDRE